MTGLILPLLKHFTWVKFSYSLYLYWKGIRKQKWLSISGTFLTLDVIQELCFLSFKPPILLFLCWGSMFVFLFYAHTSGGALSSGSSSSSLWVVSLVQNILIGVSTKKWGCHCYNTEPNVCIQIDTTKKSYELFSSSCKVLFTLQFIFNFWLVKKSKMQYLLSKLLKKKTTSNNWIWNNYVRCINSLKRKLLNLTHMFYWVF